MERQHPEKQDMSKEELPRLVKKYAENLVNLNVKIKTRKSDEV